MEAAYFTAAAILAGSTVGALTPVATSWLSQHVKFRARLQSSDLRTREDLYNTFIEGASRTYGHALQHDVPNVTDLVNLYALVNRMRVLSSPQIVESADSVVRQIIDTYLSPNMSLRDVREALGHDSMDPLRRFADACRDELHTSRPVATRVAGRSP